MNWTPVRRREARRLLAWALLLLLPMSVASCNGELNITHGYEYFLFFFVGSAYGYALGGLGLGLLSLGLVLNWKQPGNTRWSAICIAYWQLLMGTMVFVIAGDWIYGADGWFQKQLFFPFFGHYGFFFEGTWFYVDADAPLPDLFNSKTNEAAQMLDGITPLPLLGAIWWLVQTYHDVRWMLRGRIQHNAS